MEDEKFSTILATSYESLITSNHEKYYYFLKASMWFNVFPFPWLCNHGSVCEDGISISLGNCDEQNSRSIHKRSVAYVKNMTRWVSKTQQKEQQTNKKRDRGLHHGLSLSDHLLWGELPHFVRTLRQLMKRHRGEELKCVANSLRGTETRQQPQQWARSGSSWS